MGNKLTWYQANMFTFTQLLTFAWYVNDACSLNSTVWGDIYFLHELGLDNLNSINNNPNGGVTQSSEDTILADSISYHNFNVNQPSNNNLDSVE